MKANKTIPQAMRESTPVERILDPAEMPSSKKQESGLAQVYAGFELHPKELIESFRNPNYKEA